jgi:hypothetical protein
MFGCFPLYWAFSVQDYRTIELQLQQKNVFVGFPILAELRKIKFVDFPIQRMRFRGNVGHGIRPPGPLSSRQRFNQKGRSASFLVEALLSELSCPDPLLVKALRCSFGP